MARLLIANGTHQYHDFQYRAPEFDKVFSTTIGPGRQVELPFDMNEHQLRAVITQLERYGARPASDIDHLTTPRGLVFSVNRAISSEKIDEAREKDAEVRQQIADEQIEAAGVAVPAVGETAEHLNKATLEIRELQPTQREEAVKGGVDTTIEVSKNAGQRQKTAG